MASQFEILNQALRRSPKRWLVTGAAGFIGSNLVESLLGFDQQVVGLDNFATGYSHNLDDIKRSVAANQWKRFEFIEGDIRDTNACSQACKNIDYVLHQAALGSVPRSIDNPLASHQANVDGFINMLIAARDAKVKRFVYASSSSVYGDEPNLPKVEERVGNPLSPYAVTKKINEIYAENFAAVYQMEVVGLRYFNVFGPRQDPNGAYAAVLPKWIGLLLEQKQCIINGDGKTSRDFCFIHNVVQANLLAACTENKDALNRVYNVAVGERTDLNEMYQVLSQSIADALRTKPLAAIYGEFRAGDVRHSLADISAAKRLLGYEPTHTVREGLPEVVSWYVAGRGKNDKVINE